MFRASNNISTRILDEIEYLKHKELKEQERSQSGQFINGVKSSNLFQIDVTELVNTAPIALSLMGSCLIGAADSASDQIQMRDSVPDGRFVYLENGSHATLRKVLFEKYSSMVSNQSTCPVIQGTDCFKACEHGGRGAFKTASVHMELLAGNAREICNERVRPLHVQVSCYGK